MKNWEERLLSATIVLLTLSVAIVSAYHVLGGRWTTRDIYHLSTYINPNNNPHLNEMILAADSWTGPTRVNFVITSHTWEAKVFAMLAYQEAGWDGYAIIWPSPYEYPYERAETCLNTYWTQYYPDDAVQSVQAHEFGHVVGLDHETGAVLMNGYTAERYFQYGIYTPQQDDVNGVNYIYGW